MVGDTDGTGALIGTTCGAVGTCGVGCTCGGAGRGVATMVDDAAASGFSGKGSVLKTDGNLIILNPSNSR